MARRLEENSKAGGFPYSIHSQSRVFREAAALLGNFVEIPSPGPFHRAAELERRGQRDLTAVPCNLMPVRVCESLGGRSTSGLGCVGEG